MSRIFLSGRDNEPNAVLSALRIPAYEQAKRRSFADWLAYQDLCELTRELLRAQRLI